MGRKKKVMNAVEMEQWLLSKGAVPVSEETKNKPWFSQAIQMPLCLEKETKKTSRRSKTSEK